jgi:hypothetical protein
MGGIGALALALDLGRVVPGAERQLLKMSFRVWTSGCRSPMAMALSPRGAPSGPGDEGSAGAGAETTDSSSPGETKASSDAGPNARTRGRTGVLAAGGLPGAPVPLEWLAGQGSGSDSEGRGLARSNRRSPVAARNERRVDPDAATRRWKVRVDGRTRRYANRQCATRRYATRRYAGCGPPLRPVSIPGDRSIGPHGDGCGAGSRRRVAERRWRAMASWP